MQTNPQTPRPWINRMWTERFLMTCSQLGQGDALLQTPSGARHSLHDGRMVYLVDAENGEWWTANGFPPPPHGEHWQCSHGLHYSEMERARDGIHTRLRVEVAGDEPAELWTITVNNETSRQRSLRLIPFIACSIGGWFAAPVHGGRDEEAEAVVVSDVLRTGTHYAHYTDGSRVRAYMTMDGRMDGFDTRRSAFVGPYGSPGDPDAMRQGACGNTENAFEPSILALQNNLQLKPGESFTLRVLTGFYEDAEDIKAARKLHFSDSAPGKASPTEAGTLKVDLTEAGLSPFAGNWLVHQVRFNATWARVYYNGFRDLCQDLAGMAAIDPHWAWERFTVVLAHQYASGFAPRAWIGTDLVEQDYADSPVWIATTLRLLLNELRDPALLDQTIPFVEGTEEGSVFEHLRRALAYLWNDRGRHGLSRIHKGDWNDLMNAVGWHGEGESVWLTEAFIVALEDGAAVAEMYGKDEYKTAWRDKAEELRQCIRRQAVADGFFLRGFTDSGQPVGAPDSPEGIFLIPQAWAVLAGLVEGADAHSLLRHTMERLERSHGLLTIERGYSGDYQEEIGFLSTVRPGCNVNAGFYQHAAAFLIMACLRSGLRDDALRLIRKILPYTPERGPLTGEPFVLNNAYYGPAAGYREGHSDTGWITGTAGWLARILTEWPSE